MEVNAKETYLSEFSGSLKFFEKGWFWDGWRSYYFILKDEVLTRHSKEQTFKDTDERIKQSKQNWKVKNMKFSILKEDELKIKKFDTESGVLQLCAKKGEFYYFSFQRTCNEWTNCLITNGAVLDETIANQNLTLTYIPSPDLTFLKQRGSWLYNEKLRKSDYTNSLKGDKYVQLMYLKDKDPSFKEENMDKEDEEDEEKWKKQTEELMNDQGFDTFCERFLKEDVCESVLFTPISENSLYDALDGPIQKKNESFPIKLFISIPNEAPKLNKIKDFATKHQIATKFGFVHAGLQICDKIVHFMRNGFVRIDPFKGQNALFF